MSSSSDEEIEEAAFQMSRWSWEKTGSDRLDIIAWLKATRDGQLAEMIADSRKRYQEECEKQALEFAEKAQEKAKQLADKLRK